MLCKQIFLPSFTHTHDDDESQVRRKSILFLFLFIFPFLCWLDFLYSFFLPKKDECIKSRELNVLILKESERSWKEKRKINSSKIWPLFVCSSSFYSPPKFCCLLQFWIFLHLAHSVQFCRRLLSGSFLQHDKILLSTHILKKSLIILCGFLLTLTRMCLRQVCVWRQIHPWNICIVLWFYNSLIP